MTKDFPCVPPLALPRRSLSSILIIVSLASSAFLAVRLFSSFASLATLAVKLFSSLASSAPLAVRLWDLSAFICG